MSQHKSFPKQPRDPREIVVGSMFVLAFAVAGICTLICLGVIFEVIPQEHADALLPYVCGASLALCAPLFCFSLPLENPDFAVARIRS